MHEPVNHKPLQPHWASIYTFSSTPGSLQIADRMDQNYGDSGNETSPSSSQSSARPKRRSLLPQPGTPTSTIRSIALPGSKMERIDGSQPNMTVSASPKPATSIPLARGNSVTGSRLGRLRPRSIYQTGTPTAERHVEAENPTMSQSVRPPSLLSKPSISSIGGLARTQSLRRPAPATQSGPSASAGSHSRTQSTCTVSLARSNTTRPRTTAERPKSVHIPSSTAAPTTSSSAQPAPALARSSARLAGLSRSASVKTRPDVSSTGLRPRAGTKGEDAAPAPSKIMAPPPRPREAVKEEPKKAAARPAFSTLQQHFTPRKTGKAPTSTFLHPAPAPGSNSLPAELVSLQMDLLQLHLLHSNAAEVSKQWEASAKNNLRAKFDGISSVYHMMLEHERSGQEQKNLQALLEWTGGKGSGSLVQHIQVLSGPLHELPSLVQTGGRFQRHAAAFEQWVSWVQEVRTARQDRTEGGLGSIEGLGDVWKVENSALMRKLTSFARDLSGLAQPAAGSSIASIVTSCESLIDGLLDELRVMQTIEQDVVEKEKEWVESRLQGIAADISSFLVESTPAWRM